MVSFFGLKLGADKKPVTRPIDASPTQDGGTYFGPLADLPFPPTRPGTSHSLRPAGGRSPYGQLGASSSLVDLRPSTTFERPSTADPALKEVPRPGDLSHPGTWPRSAAVKTGAPVRVSHGSSTSVSTGLKPAAAATFVRPEAPASGPAQRQTRARPVDLTLSKDAAAAAMQAPPRSPLGQFEFNLRKQHVVSPVVAMVETLEDKSIVPIIEDMAAFSRPSSPAPNRALPPTPTRQTTGSPNDTRPAARPRAPSNLREVIHSNESSPAHDQRILSAVVTKSPPRMVQPLNKPPTGFTAFSAKALPVRDPAQRPDAGRSGRRMSIERDFGESDPPIFTDADRPSTSSNAPSTSNTERKFLARPPPVGTDDMRTRSASPRREPAQGPGAKLLPRGRPGGFMAASPAPAGRFAGPNAGPGPESGPRGRQNGPLPGLPSGPRPKPAATDTSSPFRAFKISDSKPPGDRVLPRISPPGPPRVIQAYPGSLRPGASPQSRGPSPTTPKSPASDEDDNDQSPCLEAGPGPSLGSGSGGSLRPSPFPAPLHTAPPALGRPQEFSPISPDSPVDSPCPVQSLGPALRPPPARAPVRRNFSAPGMQQPLSGWTRQSHPPVSPSDSPTSTSNETTPKSGGDMSRVEDRFSLTSSLYSSDSSDSEKDDPSPSAVADQKVIRPAETELVKLMQFDFGF